MVGRTKACHQHCQGHVLKSKLELGARKGEASGAVALLNSELLSEVRVFAVEINHLPKFCHVSSFLLELCVTQRWLDVKCVAGSPRSRGSLCPCKSFS